MMLTEHAEYLQATLSSELFEFAYKHIFSSIELGSNGYQYNKHALIRLPIKKVEEAPSLYTNEYFFSLYDLSKEEVDYILSCRN